MQDRNNDNNITMNWAADGEWKKKAQDDIETNSREEIARWRVSLMGGSEYDRSRPRKV